MALALAPLGCSSSTTPPAPVYVKETLDPAYRSEGVAVFDVDRDGHMDVVTDQFWYAGPAFVPHEIRASETFDPAIAYCHSFGVYAWDVDGDGWQDIVVAPHIVGDAMLWYRNPAGADVHWESHVLAPLGAPGLETPLVVALFGDGRPVLLSADARTQVLGWQTPGADPTQPWPLNAISATGFPGAGVATHGIGAGDVDGDGRLDVLTGYGWFQATADRAKWTWNEFSFGANDCSRMFALDVNGDGLADVLCAHPHDYGFRWFEQATSASGAATFVEHVIDDGISQMHALRVDDLDGDGKPELVTGKRYWAHGPSGDPGSADPALLVYYSVKPLAAAGARFERHVIDDDSGIGTQFSVDDVDGDGRRDVVVSNKKGLFVFRQR